MTSCKNRNLIDLKLDTKEGLSAEGKGRCLLVIFIADCKSY